MRAMTPFIVCIAAAMVIGWASKPLDGWRLQALLLAVVVMYVAAKQEGRGS